MNSETASRPATSALCAICQTPLGPTENEPTTTCPACDAKYHADCWLQNGGCAVYGCAQVPATEGRARIAAVVGLIWLQSNYEHVEKLPSLYAALAKIGVGVGLFQIAAIVLLALVFAM